MKHIVLYIVFTCNAAAIFSQNMASFKGKVIDKNNNPISIGNVLLLQNDRILKYSYLIDGQFSFESVPQKSYTLKVTSLGYKTYQEKIELTKNIDTIIVLEEAITTIDEVEIVATKKLIENNNGNILVNVANTILSKEVSIIDLVSKLPSIQVDPNRESITILGKGNPLIYLGGQRISVEDFKNLHIDDIKTIEIINNPSAKYEADGRSVILITRKKGVGRGTKVSFTETASFRKNFNNFLSGNINFKKDKFEFKLNAAFNDLHPWESNGAAYSIIDEDIESNYIVEADDTKRPQFILGSGFYYQINKSDYFSLSSTLSSQKDEFLIKTNTLNKENNIEDAIFTQSDNDDYRLYSSTNINYNASLSNTRNLFLGVQYSYFNKELGSDIANSLNSATLIPVQKSLQDFKIHVFSFKADFEKEFKNKFKLEIGTSTVFTTAKTYADISGLEPDITTKSIYNYTENNYAGYLQLMGKTGKLSFTAGIRSEITDNTGSFEANEDLLVDRNNVRLFPKAILSFEIDSTKNLTLNYGRSITRPNFTNISSISTYLSPFLEFNRNIELKPTLTNELSLNYNFKEYALGVNYYVNNNPVFYNIAYNAVNEISVMSPTNFEREEGYSLELTIPFNYKFWKATNVVSLNFNTIEDQRAISLNTAPYFYFYTNHQFKINNTTSFNFNCWGLSNRQEGIFDREQVYALNASISKKLFDKLDITLSFNDIFNSMEFTDRYSLQNIKARSTFYTDANEISISLKYAFGQIKSVYKNKDVDSDLNRIR